jgi:hypothetical protein
MSRKFKKACDLAELDDTSKVSIHQMLRSELSILRERCRRDGNTERWLSQTSEMFRYPDPNRKRQLAVRLLMQQLLADDCEISMKPDRHFRFSEESKLKKKSFGEKFVVDKMKNIKLLPERTWDQQSFNKYFVKLGDIVYETLTKINNEFVKIRIDPKIADKYQIYKTDENLYKTPQNILDKIKEVCKKAKKAEHAEKLYEELKAIGSSTLQTDRYTTSILNKKRDAEELLEMYECLKAAKSTFLYYVGSDDYRIRALTFLSKFEHKLVEFLDFLQNTRCQRTSVQNVVADIMKSGHMHEYEGIKFAEMSFNLTNSLARDLFNCEFVSRTDESNYDKASLTLKKKGRVFLAYNLYSFFGKILMSTGGYGTAVIADMWTNAESISGNTTAFGSDRLSAFVMNSHKSEIKEYILRDFENETEFTTPQTTSLTTVGLMGMELRVARIRRCSTVDSVRKCINSVSDFYETYKAVTHLRRIGKRNNSYGGVCKLLMKLYLNPEDITGSDVEYINMHTNDAFNSMFGTINESNKKLARALTKFFYNLFMRLDESSELHKKYSSVVPDLAKNKKFWSQLCDHMRLEG